MISEKAHWDQQDLIVEIQARFPLGCLAGTVTPVWEAGKTRHGGITRAGDEVLRSLLVVGATAVINQARRRDKATAWIAGLLARKPAKLVAVALANKMARIAWKLMVSGESYATGRVGTTAAI